MPSASAFVGEVLRRLDAVEVLGELLLVACELRLLRSRSASISYAPCVDGDREQQLGERRSRRSPPTAMIA